MQIYNEMIRDLLNPSSGYLELREDAKGVVVAGISEVEAKTTTEVRIVILGESCLKHRKMKAYHIKLFDI